MNFKSKLLTKIDEFQRFNPNLYRRRGYNPKVKLFKRPRVLSNDFEPLWIKGIPLISDSHPENYNATLKSALQTNLRVLFKGNKTKLITSQKEKSIHNMSASEFLNSSINKLAIKSLEDKIAKTGKQRFRTNTWSPPSRRFRDRNSKFAEIRSTYNWSQFSPSSNKSELRIPNIFSPTRTLQGSKIINFL